MEDKRVSLDQWVFPCPVCGTQPEIHVYSGCNRCTCGRYCLNRQFTRLDDNLGPVYEYSSLGFYPDPVTHVRKQRVIERSLTEDGLWVLEAGKTTPVPDGQREELTRQAVDAAMVSQVMDA